VLWFSRSIVLAILLGGGRVIQAISFSWMTYIIYGYLGALMLEVLLERRFRSKCWLRPLGIAALLGFALVFICGFVYACDPLTIRPANIIGDKPEGTKIAGIVWNSAYSDLRVRIENNTDNDYHNLDLILSADHFIVAEAETTNARGVQVYNTVKSADLITVTATSQDGKKTILPDDQVMLFTGGIRVTCDKLIKHGGLIEIVLALAQPRPEFQIPAIAHDAQGKLDPRFAIAESSDLKRFFGAKVDPTKVYISGTFESLGGRPRELHTSYPVKEQ
jgi:hypothetical protein